jgi:hypothetical protein
MKGESMEFKSPDDGGLGSGNEGVETKKSNEGMNEKQKEQLLKIIDLMESEIVAFKHIVHNQTRLREGDKEIDAAMEYEGKVKLIADELTKSGIPTYLLFY